MGYAFQHMCRPSWGICDKINYRDKEVCQLFKPTGAFEMGYIGSTDLPAETDDSEIGNYRDSMARFIGNCNTPMTIFIQGTWGTGKTSFMKMVRSRLTKCKFFGSWVTGIMLLSKNAKTL